MKKFASFLISLCLMLSLCTTAFAADKTAVKAQMEGAVAFITDGTEKYGVDDAYNYYTLVKSGVDLSKYNDAFIDDVKNNLKQNGGKIVTSYGESLAGYGSVIMILELLGEDITDFYGYDIIDAFSQLDPETAQSNPYFYRTIIPASAYCDEQFSKAVCDTFIKDNYTMGKGMASYGSFGCDNTAFFINALAPFAPDYKEYIKDAFTVLETYKVDGGYVYDPIYGTQANPDSTALALMAYASVSDYVNDSDYDSYLALLSDIYDELCTFESNEQGVFISQYTQEKDYFATNDALIGLEEYYPLLTEKQTDETTTQPTTAQPERNNTPDTESTQANTAKKSPQTGTAASAFSAALAFAVSALIVKKRSK